jgi:hypothetical protein
MALDPVSDRFHIADVLITIRSRNLGRGAEDPVLLSEKKRVHDAEGPELYERYIPHVT